MTMRARYLACAVLAAFGSVGAARAETSEQARLQRYAALQGRIERAESIKAIERLQNAYGYYQDRFLFKEIPKLFTTDRARVQWQDDVWEGRDGMRRLWLGYLSETLSDGTNGPVAGRIFDMPQWQGIVTVAPDNRTAQARFRTFGKVAKHRQYEHWLSAVYENDYVNEGGVWKFKTMRLCFPWSASYFEGWQNVGADSGMSWLQAPRRAHRPDRRASESERCTDRYPQAGVMSFHFDNPVTAAKPSAPITSTRDARSSLTTLEHRVGIVNDMNEIERFHHIYGWQQDYMLYYSQADLASDEPGEYRWKYGVFAGKEGARRMWVGNWAGFTGNADMPVFGAMIDHHQAQGVITVAPDRRTAKARYRTSTDRFFSRNGEGLTSQAFAAEGADHSVWYENEFVREQGMWKLKALQVCIYAEGAVGSGYSDLPTPGKLGVPLDAGADYWQPRARLAEAPPVVKYPQSPKGPDRVESPSEHGCFSAKNQTMNRSVVLPFHFPNPVTGERVVWENK